MTVEKTVEFLMWTGSMIGLGCIIWGLERIEKAIRALAR